MIREATDKDAERLAEMGAAFFAEAKIREKFAAEGLPDVEYDAPSFVQSCGVLARNGIMLVADHDAYVCGFIGGAVLPALWNFSTALCQEAWWYVEPAYRKGNGVALLNEFEKRATARGARICGMIAEIGLRGEPLGRLYKAKHYVPAETVFWKRLAA